MSWPLRRLETVADFRLGKMLDEKKKKGELKPYLANINVRWGEIETDDLREMRFEDHESEAFGLKHGDIVMCEGGEPGRCAIWKDQIPDMKIQKALHRICPKPSLNPKFLYYVFLQMGRTNAFAGLFTGATIKHLPREKLALVEVPVPPRNVQDAVARALTTYDSLIDNNRRRMVLLEESARLLYREWFVRLRFPGHERTKATDGVPNGWSLRTIGDCSVFQSGGTPRKGNTDFWDGDIPWISSGEMTSLRIIDSSLHVTREAVKDGSRLVPKNTILVVVRGMSLAKEFRLAMTGRPVAFNQDLKALTCVEDVTPEFLFSALVARRDEIRDRATEASHGTKKLDTPVLAAVTILLPNMNLQQLYSEMVQPMNSIWDNLWQQNRALVRARDMLLPRLMSGEVSV